MTAPLSQMLPLALLVLLGAALPNIGGWGPREGVTAWAFAAAGLGASLGVATAVVYGVMVFVASLPGAAVLVARWARAPGDAPGGRRMPERPYTLLSCSVSLDGYLGDQTPRLALSNEADFDRVDEVRASCDAIMVGAVTVRTDNPRLLVRSQARRDERTARGLPSSPMKITVTEPGGPRRAARTSSPPARPRSSSTPRARAWPTRARGSGRWRRSWTAAGACACAGSARTSPTAAWSG